MFCQGRAAATILGSWDVGTAKKCSIDFATAPLPVNSEGKQMAGFLGVRGFAISHWAKDYDAAVKLAKFLTQDKYSKSRFKLIGEIPASLKLLDDPDIFNDEYANAFITRMAEKGVPLNVHYKPLPLLSAYAKRGFDINDYPNAYHMFENEVTLPLHTCLTDEQAEYIIRCFNQTLDELEDVEKYQ